MTAEHAFVARVSDDDYMELNTGTGHIYEFAMRHLKETTDRNAWLNHLRLKNWFTAAHESQMIELINTRFQ